MIAPSRHTRRGLLDLRVDHRDAFRVVRRFRKPFLEKQGPAGAYAASLSVEDREALRLRLRETLLGPDPDKAIVKHARAGAVRGTIP